MIETRNSQIAFHTLRGRRLFLLARIVWLLLASFGLSLHIIYVPEYLGEISLGSSSGERNLYLAYQLGAADIVNLQQMGLSGKFYANYLLGMSIVWIGLFILPSIMIYWRKYKDPLTIYISLTFLAFGTFATPLIYGLIPVVSLPLGILIGLIAGTSFGAVLLFYYVFPDGHFYPRWMLPLAVIISFLLPIIFVSYALFNYVPQGVIISIALPLLVVIHVSGPIAQVFRYRRISNAIQRQQTKWVVFGVFTLFFGLLLTVPLVTLAVYGRNVELRIIYLLLSIPVNIIAVGMLPLTITLAILRYRLWDIDLIIRRTLVYTVLTASLGLLYFGLVILLERVLRALVGSSGQVATVISTLVIVVLFTPLRRRVQDAIDRRFYRRKYDAEKALAMFAAAARNETDLEALTAQVVSVVQDTMEPEQISLWLKPVANQRSFLPSQK